MRTLLFFSVAVFIAGCRCSPAVPQPVTLRVINTTRAPIYVEGTRGKLGLTVKRDVGGTLFEIDDLACECRFCSNACNTSCSCPDAGVDQVVKLEAGSKLERTWDGVVQLSGLSNCNSSGCLDQQNAPVNEPFTLELCFAVQKPTGVIFNDGGVGAGTLPKLSTECTTRQFAPMDLEVEISPSRGSACKVTPDCKGAGELCFDGACTTGCPANNFPALGSDWVLAVASPDNMGFFEQTARTRGNQFAGTGTLTSAQYQSNTLLMAFSRPGTVPNETLTGRVQIKFPIGTGAPVMTGREVSVLVLDDGKPAPTRAFLMKDKLTGEILLAADVGQGGRLLLPSDLTPFTVADGTVAVGCSQTSCGRLLYFPLRFSAGSAAVDVLPGAQDQLSVGSTKWNFLNVSSGAYDTTACGVTDLRPWAFWKVPAP